MKIKTVFTCIECGYESAKWLGKCPACNNWNSFVEEKEAKLKNAKTITVKKSKPLYLNEVETNSEQRYKTGMEELDRVLGGGIVKGSLVLFGGDPGIGKSTLLLQICNYLGQNNKILYVSGEESQNQIKIRSERLKINTKNLLLLSETDMDIISEYINEIKPDIVIIDSIQTIYKSEISSAPGSVSQVRDATYGFMSIAKSSDTAILLVGHMTKEGMLAGPRVLEHMVDCVLYFEGERHHSYRLLRAVKNRFGSTNEIGVFEMKDIGLCEVKNPSDMLLMGRPISTPGSSVVCTIEGTRAILAEVQGLVSPTNFGMPRRMATGIDYNRVILLLAVLEKKVGLNLSSYDAYVNVVGGIKIDETAADLGIILSIASSFKNKVIDKDIVAIGEVGLTGEIRMVSFVEKRITEACKLGFNKIIIPHDNCKGLKKFNDMEIIAVKNVSQAIDSIMK